MGPILAMLTQAAMQAGAVPQSTLPDLQITARIHADELEVQGDGDGDAARAEITFDATPEIQQDISVQRNQPPGERNYGDFLLQLDARAGIVPAGEARDEGTVNRSNPDNSGN